MCGMESCDQKNKASGVKNLVFFVVVVYKCPMANLGKKPYVRVFFSPFSQSIHKCLTVGTDKTQLTSLANELNFSLLLYWQPSIYQIILHVFLQNFFLIQHFQCPSVITSQNDDPRRVFLQLCLYILSRCLPEIQVISYAFLIQDLGSLFLHLFQFTLISKILCTCLCLCVVGVH